MKFYRDHLAGERAGAMVPSGRRCAGEKPARSKRSRDRVPGLDCVRSCEPARDFAFYSGENGEPLKEGRGTYCSEPAFLQWHGSHQRAPPGLLLSTAELQREERKRFPTV